MIKFLVMDVDGTLTDGKIYMGNDGEVFKAFDVKDGCGIKDILPTANDNEGIIPIIITARKSQILVNRCKELNLKELYQGIRNKKEKLDAILEKYSEMDHENYNYSHVAYIGDDILDLQCMNHINAAGGIVGCPRDAVKDVLKVSSFISEHDGGNGAVREFIEWIIKMN